MIALTGGTGFLGSHLLRALLAGGHEVVLLKRSTSRLERVAPLLPQLRVVDLDREDPEPIFATGRVHTVLHCATDYGRRERDPYQVVEANIVLPLRLLHLARRHGVRRFVNTDTILDKGAGHYSLSKAQFGQWLRTYADALVCVNVALEHFYGPGDDETKFVTWVMRALLEGAPELQLTPGAQRRSFVHIDDVVRAFLAILQATEHTPPGHLHFEVGALEAVSIRDFVELVQRLSGNTTTALRFGALPYRPGEIMEPNLNLAPLLALGWLPEVGLEQGLAATVAEERRRWTCAS